MEHSIQRQAIISEQYHGQRLDAVLAQLFNDYSRSLITKWIKEGLVTLNQHTAKPKDKVCAGDIIHLNVRITEQENNAFHLSQAQEIPLDIIYEDEDLLVINKPAGLVVHPGAGQKDHTLVNALLYYRPDLRQLPRAGIIHRIDKDTTGLLVVAKTLKAHTGLIRQMQAREIQRRYLGLVQGYIVGGKTIKTGFGRHPKQRVKMSVRTDGKEAVTHYRIEEHFPDFTLLDLRLMTGRTHQIRVHMAHIRHPLVGDPLYGGRAKFPTHCNDSLRAALESFRRQALHAFHLELSHPISQKTLTFHAPLPDDFNHLLKELRLHYEDPSG